MDENPYTLAPIGVGVRPLVWVKKSGMCIGHLNLKTGVFTPMFGVAIDIPLMEMLIDVWHDAKAEIIDDVIYHG